jgi:catechol 2,3-dioxygenase-like lactoylglutathione lyase family enzyme
MTSMTVGMITFDTTDARVLAAWWARHTGGTVQDPADGAFTTIEPALGGPVLAFQRVPDPTPGKNRGHLDLMVADRVATAEAMVADGALRIGDREHGAFRWTTLADPDGNQFCLAQADGA